MKYCAWISALIVAGMILWGYKCSGNDNSGGTMKNVPARSKTAMPAIDSRLPDLCNTFRVNVNEGRADFGNTYRININEGRADFGNTYRININEGRADFGNTYRININEGRADFGNTYRLNLSCDIVEGSENALAIGFVQGIAAGKKMMTGEVKKLKEEIEALNVKIRRLRSNQSCSGDFGLGADMAL